MALTIKNLQAGKKGYKIALQTALLVLILSSVAVKPPPLGGGYKATHTL